MKQLRLKIGDVFTVDYKEGSERYFQYVANDLSQLNSNVIRVFKKHYSKFSSNSINEIVKDEVEFHAHCIIKLGLKMELWNKIGNTPIVGAVDCLFRGTNDYGTKIGEQVLISQNWYVWKINQEFRKVGRLEGENQSAEIGIVKNPIDIVHRIRTGKYGYFYPGF